MRTLLNLYQAGAVKRWHTKLTIKEQDVAAHSWGVAMVLRYIYPEANADVLMAALTHDLHESEAGDIPYPFKRNNPDVAAAYSRQEAQFEEANEINVPLLPFERKLLKWCDMMELALWCKRELSLGNTSMLRTLRVAKKALEDLGSPTEKADQLFQEIFNEPN